MDIQSMLGASLYNLKVTVNQNFVEIVQTKLHFLSHEKE